MNLITILPIALVLAVLSTGVLAGGKCSDPYCSDSDCDGETEGWVKVDGEERWVGKGEPIPKTKAGDRWLLVNYEARFFKDGESPATHPGQPVAEEDRNIKYCSGGDQPGCPHSRGKKKGGLIKSIKKGLSKKK
ncbi:uncharacterized protein LOC116341895 [Contarinia nasturtii]|uniref:uncharacterized protein LOC116341895 n=1 Tax=Contarinia nasturtii TaxID=265458 RepID=UPI0012D4A733|nr:uncharacterized protein LOC116341895 [Contarinia nasturtii]